MGMLHTILKRVPDEKDSNEYIRKIHFELEEHFSQHDNSCESYHVGLVREHNFDQIWNDQETYKNTTEIKDKYKNIAKQGKLVYVEIDY
jgi:hypothetical protein